ncbi:protein rai1 [Cladorrhinum samala]|uniref:Decapping nuclease n=1 Tax=Cladorrhinum samala TaxID=585594 RepID=A0AAV9H9X5_9PEZI|nr:protein rai1 [Cladorrhinum samala]
MATVFTFPVSSPSQVPPKSDGRVKRPREFTCFSYDGDRRLRLDDSGLKWYYPPSQSELENSGGSGGIDLSKGFERFDKHDEDAAGDEHLVGLLKALMDWEEKEGKKAVEAGGVVTWRGMMTKIMAVGGGNGDEDGFEMNATLYRDCIFIEENYEYKVKRNAEQSSRPQRGQFSSDQMSFWGYKFETLCTLPRPWGECSRDLIESRDDQVVSNKEQYCSVVRTAIDDVALCLGGEVDCIWDAKPADPSSRPINWVELKTCAEMRNPNDELWFREKKLMKFWIQSYLLGVPKLVVGFRDRQGRLRRIEEMETAMIPRVVNRDPRVRWSADGCIDFAARFLKWLRQTINDEGVWRIRRLPKAREIEVWRVEETGHGDILTEEFMNWRIKLEMRQQAEKQAQKEEEEEEEEDGQMAVEG